MGQKSNEVLFDSLTQSFLNSQSVGFDSVVGFLPENLDAYFEADTSSGRFLRIGLPTVEYRELEKGKYLRTVEVEFEVNDSASMAVGRYLSDTLSSRQLARVNRSSRVELRGDDPRWRARILWPAILVGGGVAGIISLFYIRSS